MTKNDSVVPFLKWAGGKRQLLGSIGALLPEYINSYCEPFLGGGAVLFSIQPGRAVVNDLNADLIAAYETIRDDLDSLIEDLKQHENNSEYYYAIRNLDRTDAYRSITKVQRASRFLYLNRTCFNGLFRVNASGQFNVPFGKYKNPNIINELVLRAVSEYLASNDITFRNEDFASVLQSVPDDCFIYLDPPYDPVSSTAAFTGYQKDGFDRNEQIRLKKCLDKLSMRGVKFLLSNSATDFIKELYRDYDIKIVRAKRAINANADKRGPVDELLIRNYK